MISTSELIAYWRYYFTSRADFSFSLILPITVTLLFKAAPNTLFLANAGFYHRNRLRLPKFLLVSSMEERLRITNHSALILPTEVIFWSSGFCLDLVYIQTNTEIMAPAQPVLYPFLRCFRIMSESSEFTSNIFGMTLFQKHLQNHIRS